MLLLPRRDGRGTHSQVWPLLWACLPQCSLLGGAEVAPGLAVTRRGTPGQKAVFQQGSPCPSPLSCPHSGSLASACVALRVTAFHPLQCLREGPHGVGSVPLGGALVGRPFPGLWAPRRWGLLLGVGAPAEIGLPKSHSPFLLLEPLRTQATSVSPQGQLRLGCTCRRG